MERSVGLLEKQLEEFKSLLKQAKDQSFQRLRDIEKLKNQARIQDQRMAQIEQEKGKAELELLRVTQNNGNAEPLINDLKAELEDFKQQVEDLNEELADEKKKAAKNAQVLSDQLEKLRKKYDKAQE